MIVSQPLRAAALARAALARRARLPFGPLLTILALAACSPEAPPPVDPPVVNVVRAPAADWDMMSGEEGSRLVLAGPADKPIALFFCPAGEDRLVVNLPAFAAVGSEERMTLGAEGTVVTLVADPSGDAVRGGVSGEGPVPAELDAILASPAGVSVNYGYQNAGPFPAIPADRARAFGRHCRS